MVYDLNEEFSRRRQSMSRGIQKQMQELDEQMEELQHQQEEVCAAQDALTQLEAVLRRMSILAREAAASPRRRRGLEMEFEDCKRRVEALSRNASIFGFPLVTQRAEIVHAVLEELMEKL